MVEFSDHSLMLCSISDMEGTRYSTIEPFPAYFSAMCKAVMVLPDTKCHYHLPMISVISNPSAHASSADC